MIRLLLPFLALAAQTLKIEVPSGNILVSFSDYSRSVSDSEIISFITHSTIPVAAYYGKFPVQRLSISVVQNKRNPHGLFGQEFHGDSIQFYLGAEVKHFDNDQILTHEMFHLGFPDLAEEEAWIEEGLATYLAHLTRARVGQTTEEEFWKDASEGFADAQRRKGESGFAEEENYHRMYWGGALFWFEIDLEIRERSLGKKSLDTVTRALVASGGTNGHRWSLARLRRNVDRAAGFPVFQKWVEALGTHPGHVDLEKTWKDLGVVPGEKSVKLDDTAPLASTRKALMHNLGN